MVRPSIVVRHPAQCLKSEADMGNSSGIVRLISGRARSGIGRREQFAIIGAAAPPHGSAGFPCAEPRLGLDQPIVAQHIVAHPYSDLRGGAAGLLPSFAPPWRREPTARRAGAEETRPMPTTHESSAVRLPSGIGRSRKTLRRLRERGRGRNSSRGHSLAYQMFDAPIAFSAVSAQTPGCRRPAGRQSRR